MYKQDLVKDKPTSGVQNISTLAGWVTDDKVQEEILEVVYNTAAFDEVYGASSYSRYRAGIKIKRGAAVYFLKILPPIGSSAMETNTDNIPQ